MAPQLSLVLSSRKAAIDHVIVVVNVFNLRNSFKVKKSTQSVAFDRIQTGS